MLSPLFTKISMLLFGFATCSSLWAAEAIAADRVVMKYSVLQRSVSVDELATFAETGEPSSSLQSYIRLSGRDPDEIRQALNRDVNVDVVLLDRVLNTPIGDRVLDQVGQAIYPPSGGANRQAIRSALILSASDDDRIRLIEVIQNYPTQEVVVDGDRLVTAYRDLQAFQERAERIFENGINGIEGLFNRLPF